MNAREFRDRLFDRKLNRRQILAACGAAGLAAIALPIPRGPAKAAGDITFMTWVGYDTMEAMPAYYEKYGRLPDFSIFGEEEEGLQKMRAGYTPDIAHPCSYSVGRWRESGLFKPIDTGRLQHYPDLFDQLKEIPITKSPEGTWFVPWEWGTSSVLFRTDLAPEYVGAENHSWRILFDEKYANRLGIFDSVDGAVIVAALVAGVEDPFAMTEEELARVKALMMEQRKVIRYYWTDQTSVEQGLASGEIVASYAWPSSVTRLREEGLPVEYMNPKEGILTYVCGFMLLKDAPGDEQAAYDLMDAMLAPEAGEWLIDTLGFGHSNRKSFERLSEMRLAEVGISSPEDLFERGVLFEPIESELREKYNEMLLEVKAGL